MPTIYSIDRTTAAVECALASNEQPLVTRYQVLRVPPDTASDRFLTVTVPSPPRARNSKYRRKLPLSVPLQDGVSWVASGHRSVTNGSAVYKKPRRIEAVIGQRDTIISDWFSGVLPFMHRPDELDRGVLADVLLG